MKYLVVILLLIPVLATAGVNLKNGNFHITYTDLVRPGGITIERTYNSRSPDIGLFGFGWGSDYETYLEVNGDGSITVRENGSGATRRYSSAVTDAEAISRSVDTIVLAMTEAGQLISAQQKQEFASKMMQDAELRDAYWKSLVKQGKVAAVTLPVGMVLTTSRDNNQIIVTAFGFIRKQGTDSVQRYNKQGLLLRTSRLDGTFVDIQRNSAGHMRRLSNQLGEQVFVETNADGKVLSLTAANGEATRYHYQNNNLVRASDTGGNSYQYEYDNNHNLTRIVYTDRDDMVIEYSEKNQFVTRIVQSDGDEVMYEYFNDDLADTEPHKYGRITERYGTRVITNDGRGRQRVNTYRYTISLNNLGVSWTSNILTEVNGVVTATEYHPCGSPLSIRRGNNVTLFDYNDNCMLTFKQSGNVITRLRYDSKHGKITKVATFNLDEQLQSEYQYRYDEKANLLVASDNRGKRILLSYDPQNRISRLETEDGSKMTFEYNVMGKPELIRLDGVGSIHVKYDDKGEIVKVESPDGHKMALQVTQRFQQLLALVKPAGVNFNM